MSNDAWEIPDRKANNLIKLYGTQGAIGQVNRCMEISAWYNDNFKCNDFYHQRIDYWQKVKSIILNTNKQ